MKTKWTITIIISIISFYCSAQEKYKGLNISMRYHQGLIMPHNKFIYNNILSQINGAEINIGFVPTSKPWSSNYAFPEVGLGIMHENLGNKDIFGSSTAIFPYIDFHLLNKKKLSLKFHLGLGVCYTNKKFNVIDNYKNIAISSDLNAFILLNANLEYSISPYISLTTGLGANHISNGSSSQPNRGLNILSYNIGFKTYINAKKQYETAKSKSKNIAENHEKYINISYINGFRRTAIKDPHRYYVSCLGINYVFVKGVKHKYNIGIDIFYDESTNRGTWDYKPKTSIDYRLRQGVHIAHTLCIGRIGIYTEMGVYVYSKASTPSAIYNRLGIDYNLTKQIMARISLKAHMAKAEIIEFGLAYNFTK